MKQDMFFIVYLQNGWWIGETSFLLFWESAPNGMLPSCLKCERWIMLYIIKFLTYGSICSKTDLGSMARKKKGSYAK